LGVADAAEAHLRLRSISNVDDRKPAGASRDLRVRARHVQRNVNVWTTTAACP
jgi:hypothetical protein